MTARSANSVPLPAWLVKLVLLECLTVQAFLCLVVFSEQEVMIMLEQTQLGSAPALLIRDEDFALGLRLGRQVGVLSTLR